MTEQIQNRGEDSDRCAWPRCLDEGGTIFSPGATPLNKFRACICDRHLALFFHALPGRTDNPSENSK